MAVKIENPLQLRLITLFVGGVAMLAIGGCGERPPEKIAQTGLAAKVNGREITVQQIDGVLRSAAVSTSAPAARKQLLERLIDQELAVQKALDTHLDRNANVVGAVENSRREILARAYVEQVVGGGAKPDPAETRRFHDAHPELFSERKIYRLEEFAFAASPGLMGLVREQLRIGKSTTDIMAGLKERGVDAVGGVAVKPAEQLALEILPRLASARTGQTMLFENNGRAALITVLGTKAEPLDAQKSLAVAEDYLVRLQRNQAVVAALKGMRDVAKIEYFGEFSPVSLAMGEAEKEGSDGAIVRPAEKGGR